MVHASQATIFKCIILNTLLTARSLTDECTGHIEDEKIIFFMQWRQRVINCNIISQFIEKRNEKSRGRSSGCALKMYMSFLDNARLQFSSFQKEKANEVNDSGLHGWGGAALPGTLAWAQLRSTDEPQHAVPSTPATARAASCYFRVSDVEGLGNKRKNGKTLTIITSHC